MGDILNGLQKLIEWRLGERARRQSGVLEYLDVLLADCVALTSWDGQVTDASRLQQERLRAYYSAASMVLGDYLGRDERELVSNAVASARIYYWIRALEGRSNDEVRGLIAARGGMIGAGFTSLSVVEKALAAYRAPHIDGDVSFEEGVAELRTHCIKDIALLEELRHRLAASQAT